MSTQSSNGRGEANPTSIAAMLGELLARREELRQQGLGAYARVLTLETRIANAVAALLQSLAAKEKEIEGLREAVRLLCDEFEDATYDTSFGTQSRDRKELVVRCRMIAEQKDG